MVALIVNPQEALASPGEIEILKEEDFFHFMNTIKHLGFTASKVARRDLKSLLSIKILNLNLDKECK